MNTSNLVQMNWFLISTPVTFHTEDIARREKMSHRRRCPARGCIMQYLEISSIFQWSLVSLLLTNYLLLIWWRRKILSCSDSSSKSRVFGSKWIWSRSRIQSPISRPKPFLIISGLCSCAILLNSIGWTNVLRKLSCHSSVIARLTSAVISSVFSPRNECMS
jgi:hypothetical protein